MKFVSINLCRRDIEQALRALSDLHGSLNNLPDTYEQNPTPGPHIEALKRQVLSAVETYRSEIEKLRKLLPEVDAELKRVKANQGRLGRTRRALHSQRGRQSLKEYEYSNRQDIEKGKEVKKRIQEIIKDAGAMINRATAATKGPHNDKGAIK